MPSNSTPRPASRSPFRRDKARPERYGNTGYMLNEPTAQYGFIFGLDGLRLIAVTIVVIRHFDVLEIMPGGFGVSIFFFISGFLITRLLLAEEKKLGRIGLGNFYVRRFIRLLPPLLLMGIVAVPVLLILKPSEVSVSQIVLSFLYLGNYSEVATAAMNLPGGWGELGPLWSLAVEEQFYILLPPLLLFVKGVRARLVAVAAVLVIPLILRIGVFMMFDERTADSINYLSTPMRLDALAWGVFLTLLLDAGILRPLRHRWGNHLLVWGGCVLMLLTLIHWSDAYEYAIKYTPQSIAIGITFFGVIFGWNYGWLRSALEWKPVRHLGKISYEIYLWHSLIFTVTLVFIPNAIGAVIVATLATVVVSQLAYELTTKKLRKVRIRFGGHPVS